MTVASQADILGKSASVLNIRLPSSDISSVTMNAIAVYVDGYVYYNKKDKEIIERWRSGELFNPKTPSKTK